MTQPTQPKYELTDLEINEGSLVDKGDNPEAHVRLFKSAESAEGAAGEGEAAGEGAGEEEGEGEAVAASPAKRALRKLWEWVAGAPSPVEKMEARTTAEILRADRFAHEFSKLRWAFMDSVSSILEYSDAPAMAPMLEVAVAEFSQEAQKITSEIAKASPEEAEELRSILDRMGKSVSKGAEAPGRGIVRADFAKAVADLEAFEVPKSAQEETDPMTTNTEKNFETLLAAMSDDDRAIVAAELDKAKKNPFAKPDEDEDEKAAAKKTEETTEKAELPDAIAKRFDELEKRAADAEAKVEKMEDEKLSETFVAKAKKLVPGGLDHAELGSALKAAHARSPEEGETLEKLFAALGAQVEKSSLFSVVGSAAPVGKTGDAHSRLESRAAEIKKAATDRGEAMSDAQAYDAAMDENPDLASQAVG